MSPVEKYLAELEAAVHVRGHLRRRLLTECRDHLAESSAVHGPAEAVRRFGPVVDLARSFDADVTTHRALRATVMSVAGVLGVAGSALALLNAGATDSHAPVWWAVVFFGSAQVSGVCLALAALRAAAMRRGVASPSDLAVLCRRNMLALGFAMLTLFATGAAVSGQTSAWKVLAGPAVAILAGAGVMRARLLTRSLDPHAPRVVRDPLSDAATLVGWSTAGPGSPWPVRVGTVLTVAVVVSMALAFTWDQLDHGSLAASAAAAATEGVMIVGGFLLLGRSLGLRPTR